MSSRRTQRWVPTGTLVLHTVELADPSIAQKHSCVGRQFRTQPVSLDSPLPDRSDGTPIPLQVPDILLRLQAFRHTCTGTLWHVQIRLNLMLYYSLYRSSFKDRPLATNTSTIAWLCYISPRRENRVIQVYGVTRNRCRRITSLADTRPPKSK
jgi:hypothetical protein